MSAHIGNSFEEDVLWPKLSSSPARDIADALRFYNRTADGRMEFTPEHLRVLADFCAAQVPKVNWERWIDYVVGVNKCSAEGANTPGQHDNPNSPLDSFPTVSTPRDA
jgi:hypothetical protein